MRDVVREFMDYNRKLALRSPELLRLNVARMAAGRLPKKGEAGPAPSERTPPAGAAVDDLIRTRPAARRPDFINRLTEPRDGARVLHRAHGYFNVSDAERERAVRLLADYRKRHV